MRAFHDYVHTTTDRPFGRSALIECVRERISGSPIFHAGAHLDMLSASAEGAEMPKATPIAERLEHLRARAGFVAPTWEQLSRPG